MLSTTHHTISYSLELNLGLWTIYPNENVCYFALCALFWIFQNEYLWIQFELLHQLFSLFVIFKMEMFFGCQKLEFKLNLFTIHDLVCTWCSHSTILHIQTCIVQTSRSLHNQLFHVKAKAIHLQHYTLFTWNVIIANTFSFHKGLHYSCCCCYWIWKRSRFYHRYVHCF